MALTARMSKQRRTNHRDLVTATNQQTIRQQHLRFLATHTTGPTRPNPPFTTNTAHRSRTPMRPPGQPVTTRRAPQQALRQLPLDLIRISLYHEDHDASGITQEGPPRPSAKKDEGVLARTPTSSPRRTNHTPSSSPPMAKPHYRVVIQRGV